MRSKKMSDDEVEDMVLDLIEVHLDEKRRKVAREWLDKRTTAYLAMQQELGLV